MSDILKDAMTPSQVVDLLRERGIIITERSLRERARAIGAYRKLGRTVILLPEHIDAVFAEPEKARLKRRGAKREYPKVHAEAPPRRPEPKPTYLPVIMRNETSTPKKAKSE